MITCNNVEFVGNTYELKVGINNFFESGFFSGISEKIKITVSRCEKGFAFECTEEGVNISYNQKNDFFRALSYLKRYIKNNDNVRLVQKPITDFCGVMLDCSRNAVRNIDSLKKQIRIMSLMGMNSLMLYTEDTYEIKGEPYFGYLRGRYTEKEILEIDDYAFSLGIELIPCIQTLGHLTSALRWSCFDDIRDTEDVLMCDEEKTYVFLEKAILQIKKLFRTNQIHIGMDEAQMMGNGQYFEKYGYVDSKTVMLRHVNRVVKLCKKYGLKPMMWSDMYFRLATGTYGDPDHVINEQTAEEMHKKIPDGLTLVYWQYEETDKELYSSLLNEHKKLTPNIMYAGGASIWGGFTPHIGRSIKSATAALNACKEKDVKKLFADTLGRQWI